MVIGLVSLLLMNAFGCTSLDGFGFGVMVGDFDESFCVLLRNSFCMFLTELICMGPNGLPMEFLRREFLRLEESDVVEVFFLISVEALVLALTSLVVFWPDGDDDEDGVVSFLLVVLCDDVWAVPGPGVFMDFDEDLGEGFRVDEEALTFS